MVIELKRPKTYSINDLIFTTSVAVLSLISFINDNKHVSTIYRLMIQMILAKVLEATGIPLMNGEQMWNILQYFLSHEMIPVFLIMEMNY